MAVPFLLLIAGCVPGVAGVGCSHTMGGLLPHDVLHLLLHDVLHPLLAGLVLVPLVIG